MRVGFLLVSAGMLMSWSRFPVVWSENRAHGFLVGAACAWVIWRDRHTLSADARPLPLLALLLFVLSALWMIAVSISAQVIHLALAPLILLLWFWSVRGTTATRALFPVAAAFLLAVPVWEILTPILQQLTVIVNRIVLEIIRIDAVVTGTRIQLSSGILEVAESCAGLNFLLAGLSLGAIYALLFVRDWRIQLRLVVVAAALSIVSNWIRVLGLVIIGHVTEMQSSLMGDHLVYGWIIFGLSMLIFGALAQRIEKRDPSLNRHDEPAPDAVVPATASSGSALFWLTTAAAISGPTLLLLLKTSYSAAVSPASTPSISPMSQWVATTGSRSDWTPSLEGFSRHSRQHLHSGERVVQIDRYIFGTTTQHAEMISSDNRIAPDSLVLAERILGPLDDSFRNVREVVVSDGQMLRVIWTWYRAGGSETPMGTRAKLLEFWGLLSNAASPETVVASTTCSTKDCLEARASLHEVVVGRPLPEAPHKP
jgi:exosortase